jgi:hypothetical protein
MDRFVALRVILAMDDYCFSQRHQVTDDYNEYGTCVRAQELNYVR